MRPEQKLLSQTDRLKIKKYVWLFKPSSALYTPFPVKLKAIDTNIHFVQNLFFLHNVDEIQLHAEKFMQLLRIVPLFPRNGFAAFIIQTMLFLSMVIWKHELCAICVTHAKEI